MIKKMFIIITLFILGCHCDKDEKCDIPDEYYNVEYTNNAKKNYEPGSEMDYVSVRIFGDNLYKYRYTSFSEQHEFLDNHHELEFHLFRYYSKAVNKIDNMVDVKCVVGMRHYGSKSRCFYITWVQNKKSIKKLDLFDRWDISKYTDTIYTNLDEKLINKIYPEFKGICLNGNIKEINVSHNYEIYDDRFYHKDIKLIGFDRFYERAD